MDSLPPIVFSAFVLWALAYLPGLALVAGGATSLPTLFARIAASAITTTLVATGLAAAEAFSLKTLLAGNAAAAFVLLAARSRLASAPAPSPRAVRDLVGPAVFVLALGTYWPAYPVFLGGSDATAYVASGISLARHGTLAREDGIGPVLPPPVRAVLFDSMSQVFMVHGPPYRRVPGAMLLESLDDDRAWPCFFPVPSVWAGISALRSGELRAQAAPDFAPVFAALALWAFWLLAQQWLGTAWGIAATAVLGATGPWYTAAHMPMSEPIAAFFVLGGLAFTAAAERSGRRADALLAGAALGAALFTRVEMAVLLVLAFALMPVVARGATATRLPRVFFTALAVVASLTVVQAVTLPGTYISPLLDHWANARINYALHFGWPSAGLVATAAAGAIGIAAMLVRAFGLAATVRWTVIAGAIGGQAAASNFLYERTPMWLSFYVGWSGLALFAVGAVLAWRARAELPAGAFVLSVAAAVSVILFYNPHVYPALPWGARRYVPMLLPLVVLLATFAARRASGRSRVLGVALAAVLAWPVAAGLRPVWREPIVAGAWEQLHEVADAIPLPGIALIDRELSRLMIAPSLWLIFDRNNLTVPPIDTKPGSELIPEIVSLFAGNFPVYYVTRGAGDHRRPPYLNMVAVKSVTVRLRSLELTYDRLPERMRADVVPITIYRLDPSSDPNPGIVK